MINDNPSGNGVDRGDCTPGKSCAANRNTVDSHAGLLGQNRKCGVQFNSIQLLLAAAGNVSKILWPHKKYQARRERLRQLLKVENDNLLADRKFRNHLEHYEERIEEWFSNVSSVVYTDLAMNPALRGSCTSNDHRGYNSFNNTLVFRGESLDLGKVVNALEDLLDTCKPYTFDYAS